jgi:hypothetical protein
MNKYAAALLQNPQSVAVIAVSALIAYVLFRPGQAIGAILGAGVDAAGAAAGAVGGAVADGAVAMGEQRQIVTTGELMAVQDLFGAGGGWGYSKPTKKEPTRPYATVAESVKAATCTGALCGASFSEGTQSWLDEGALQNPPFTSLENQIFYK